MLINEISIKTGLSKKAIRLYEEKGLLNITRSSNGYRIYSEDDLLKLNKIKLLRMCGVSISDIKMYINNIISLDELFSKRKSEIEKEAGKNSNQLNSFINYMTMYKNKEFSDDTEFLESNIVVDYERTDDFSVGIDIGTTTISVAVINITKKNILEVYSVQNNSDIVSDIPQFKEQNPNWISKRVSDLLQFIVGTYENIKSIGITGQMHGILYLDKEGNAVSNFVTWRDSRADLPTKNNESYCDEIKEITGYSISTGYGMATNYYNLKNGLIPNNAYTFCNITDYVLMKLTNKKIPLIHTSMAASFGIFDIKTYSFDVKAVEKIGLDKITLPNITKDTEAYGTYNGIPVFVPIGDNQASFLGSVSDTDNSVLINIGTGSQISIISNECDLENDNVEVRPFINDKYLICGAALCGGKSYSILERFFREYISIVDNSEFPQYEFLNKLASDAYKSGKSPLLVETTFRGKRNDTNIKGKILNITEDNFTPSQLALGFIYGMCRELYAFFENIDYSYKTVVASGNAIQKNPVFKNVITDIFNAPVKVSKSKEEAAVGAALFSMLGLGLLSDKTDLSDFIIYEENIE